MRRLILSDIHGNIDALRAVLEDARGQYDEIVCCGDLVGYGACPSEVVDWARSAVKVLIRGNHDRACSSADGLEWFNASARNAVLWTMESLSGEQRDWLAALPQGPLLFEDFEVAHGSPGDEDEYVVTTYDVAAIGEDLHRPLCFIGHTHLQRCWVWDLGGLRSLPVPVGDEPQCVIALEPGSLYLVNPGSVGQPRDRNPHAAYAIWDDEARTILMRRIPYDIAAAQNRILAAGLDAYLAERLAYGA